MRIARHIAVVFAVGVAVFASFADAKLFGCPFCSAPSLTFSEQLATADAAVLVQWVATEKGKTDEDGTVLKPDRTIYEITRILRDTKDKSLKKGDKIELARLREDRHDR